MHGLARAVRWPGYERLRPVPREVGDTPAHTSRGPTKATPILGFSEEFFMRLGGVRLRSVGMGGMARAGLLMPGYHFRDLTAHYVNLQGVVRVAVDWWDVPTRVEVALTSAHGFFVARRTPEQWAMIEERGAEPEDVYQAKSPVVERFMAVRVAIGDVTVETYNDVVGGKDKGPSFGAHATVNVQRLLRARR